MVNLHTRDLHEVLEISHKALACETMAELQQQALIMMERAIGATSSVYANLTQTRPHVRVIEGAEHGVSQGSMTRWCTRYQSQDPFLQRYLTRLSSSSEHVVLSCDVISHKEYVSTRFYNEFMHPQSIYHVMIVGLKTTRGAPFGLIGLHRPFNDRAFSSSEAVKANLLAPCLRGAVERIFAREQLDACIGSANEASETNNGKRSLQTHRLRQFELSSREIDVVHLVHTGLTSAQIADQLCISVRTVSNHLRSIYEKTGVHNRTALLYRLTT